MVDAATGGDRAASQAGNEGAARRADGCCHWLLQMLPAYDAASRGCDATSWSGEISFRRVFSFLFLGGPFSASMKQKRVFFFVATNQKPALQLDLRSSGFLCFSP
jgi:hypothetical protein